MAAAEKRKPERMTGADAVVRSLEELGTEIEFVWPPKVDLPGYKPNTKPHNRQIAQAAKMIAKAKRPVLYIGGGVVKANAHKQLAKFVEATGIPVVTTLMALGTFPHDHPLYLGMPGMHGTVPAVGAFQESDLLIAIGARFDDRVTGDTETFAPHAKVIHADIDPAEVGKIRPVDVPIVGDAKRVLSELTDYFDEKGKVKALSIQPWIDRLMGLKERFPRGYEEHSDGTLAPPVCAGDAVQDRRLRRNLCLGRGPAPDVGRPVHRLRQAAPLDQLRRRRNDGLFHPGRDGC